MEKRLSDFVQTFVEGLDALSGKCFSEAERLKEEPEDALFLFPYISALMINDEVLGSMACLLEKCVAKPLYSIENRLLGRKREYVRWMFD